MLQLLAGAGACAITWGTPDTNGGDVTVTATAYCDVALGTRNFSTFWRCNDATLVVGTSDYYEANLDESASTLTLYARNGGSSTTLASVTGLSLAANDWYYLSGSGNGSTQTVYLQRASDENYWYSGAWNSFPGNAITETDSSISGAGYAGLIGDAGLSSDIYFDDWVFETYSTSSLVLTASVGTISVVGVRATLEHDRELVGVTGTINVVGRNATLLAAAMIDGAPGTINVVGVNGSLLHDRDLVGGVGTIEVVGLSADLLYPYVLSASCGTISVVGVNEDLAYGHVTVAAPGVINVNGISASLVFSGELVLLGSPGQITIGRIDGSLLDDRILFGLPGTIEVVGVNAAVTTGFEILGAPGTINVVGVDGTLDRQIDLYGAPTAIMVVGVQGTLFVSLPGGGMGPVGYHVYENTGAADPINYNSPVDATSLLTYTTGILAYPGTWSFGVRAYYVDSALEEQNLDCYTTIVLDGSGNDITNRPLPPTGLRALPLAQGVIRAEWYYRPTSGPKTPTGFHVYTANGVLNYTTPTATVLWTTGARNSFVANMPGFTGGTTYTVGVRAYNAVAEEPNTTTVTVTAITSGPAPVDSLTGFATAQS
ncbi:MAG: hypothetical protein ACYDCI_00190 [Candidatus Limnocylindrales bacterium]